MAKKKKRKENKKRRKRKEKITGMDTCLGLYGTMNIVLYGNYGSMEV